MYYDRETQQKKIKHLLVFMGAIISFAIIATIGMNVSKSIGFQNDLYKVISVTDGDTINIDYYGTPTPIRLIGVNTPEVNSGITEEECFGPEASNYLKSLLTDKHVEIELDSTQDNVDKYGRLLRYVYLNGEDVGLMVINGGYGSEYTYNNERPYKKQSEYQTIQLRAKNNKRGQWADGVCNEQEELKEKSEELNKSDSKEESKDEPKDTERCMIKGNISNKGEKIYHVPGQQYYEDTIISTSKGERWFCTEQEAENAGWRKSKV